MLALQVLIAAALGWLAFAYAGYPLLLLALRSFSPRPVARGEVVAPVSVVIAVHDGARELATKLESVLAQDYSGKLEVIVSSDASTDDTVAVARRFAQRGVVALESGQRGGKEAAQARALRIARGDLIVLTDVAGELAPGALRAIVRPFADPGVGCVSSEDEVEGGAGEGAYVRFEMFLRRLESECATLVGVSGSFFAIRRELADGWREDLASDFRSALEAARRGLRVIAEPGARARFRTAQGDAVAEWERKVRTVRRGLAVLSAYTDLLHPRHGRAALALWGHKVARFTSPFALLLVLAASCAGSFSSPWMASFLAVQLAAYALAGAALLWSPLERIAPLRLAAFFLLVNASMLVAWIHHLRGERVTIWEPTRR
jgi:cellulose synthase/poly-beta-1,6-N-acetylglucosamine synthase-like glycosyltransferase